jgi:hypothetical protein
MSSQRGVDMPAPECRSSREELRELVGMLVEEKLREMMGDPDEDQQVQETVLQRLSKQRRAVATGERGRTLDEVFLQLGWEWAECSKFDFLMKR